MNFEDSNPYSYPSALKQAHNLKERASTTTTYYIQHDTLANDDESSRSQRQGNNYNEGG